MKTEIEYHFHNPFRHSREGGNPENKQQQQARIELSTVQT